MNTEEKKIAVIGIGGVGGYIAGMLAKAYPHVTMVARGARAESIRKNGLVLHSDYKGEIVARPERVASVREMGQQDYIFICVKNYSLEDVCESIRDMVTEDTVIIPGDIEVEIWRKYILNCAFNVMTAFYDNTIGELRSDPVKAQQYETLVWEAASVGRAKGVALTDEHINEVIHKFRHVHADNATSSLQRDFRIRRKQTELETFSGYIVKEAKRLGVSIPLSEKMYQGLKEMAAKF